MALSRRDFVQTAGALAGAASLAGSGRAFAANDQINLGFVGIGIQGSSHLRLFNSYPGVRVVAIADLYDGHHHTAKGLNPAIEVPRTTAPCWRGRTSMPWSLPRPSTGTSASSWTRSPPKTVYCEKPLTWTIAEGAAIIAAADKTDKILMVGSQGKTADATAVARQVIKSGKLGQITMVSIGQGRNDPEGAWEYPIPPDASPTTVDWERFLGAAPRRAFDAARFFRWRCFSDYSGGVSTDLMSDQLTTLHEFMDVVAPVSAVSHGGILRWKDGRDLPDLQYAALDTSPASWWIPSSTSTIPIPCTAPPSWAPEAHS